MAFTIGSGTFTNGSATVTGVTLTSGTLAYFASGTRMVVGVNPVVQEVEAIAAPTVSTITLRSAWTGTGGTYSFLANQTSEGLRDAVQAIRTNNASLQSFIDSIDTAATANSVAQRTSDGSLNVNQLNAATIATTGNVGVGVASASQLLDVQGGSSPTIKVRNTAVSTGNFSQVLLESANSFSGTSTSFIRSISTNGGNSSTALTFGTNADGGGAAAERLRIDSSGNVGIGTSPSSILDVSATSPTVIVRDNRTSASWTSGVELGKIDFYTSDTTGIGAHSIASIGTVAHGTNAASPDGVLTFSTGAYNSLPTEKVRIDPFGNVGIGTSSPEAKLEVRNGAIQAGNGTIKTAMSYADGGIFGTFSNHHLSVYTNSAERMRIDSSGNVGIGTSSPVSKIDIFNNSATDGNIRTGNTVRKYQFGLTGATSGEYLLYDVTNSQSVYSYLNTSGHIFYTSSAERMRITSSGNVLVGTTASVYSTAAKFELLYDGAQVFGSNWKTTSSDGVPSNFVNSAGTRVGYIYCTNTTTSYNTSSDYRLKEDWRPMDCACDRVMQLNPVNFAWKSSGERVDGFLAHELQEVIPEAVTGEKDETQIEEYEVEPAVYEDVVIPAEFDEEGNEVSPERTEQKLVKEAVMGKREVPVYQGIDQSKVVPLLTASLQEALRTIKAQGDSIAALEARIEALEG